jgi:hypothetical protein
MIMTKREAQIELKKCGWIRKSTNCYVYPPRYRTLRHIRNGVTFREACSLEAISFE